MTINPEARRVHFCLFIFLCIRTIVGSPAEQCGPHIDETIPGKVFLKLYNKDLTYVKADVENLEVIKASIDTSKPTVIHLHGWTESTNSSTAQRIITAYVARGGVNVIAVDWSFITQYWNYRTVYYQMPAVAKYITTVIEKLSIDPHKLHFVGYSLGAHLAGYVGKFMNGNIGRITGLDPAFMLFYPGPCHVNATDAEVVTLIHTDNTVFGVHVTSGTADFFANPTTMYQPGCTDVLLSAWCSHSRSVKYFVESLNNPKAFPATKCPKDGNSTKDDRIVYFGDATPKDIRGEYCFTTNAEPPYGQGYVK